jgi:predicted signal transduction protein with EAL and GGDEF domain
MLARLGGDEFAIIQTEPGGDQVRVTGPADCREPAIVLANRILEQFKQPFDLGTEKVFVGSSIGISLAPADGCEPDDLLKKADLALYETKSHGRNGYSFYEPRMIAMANERQQLEADMHLALVRGEFEMHYQPIVDAQTLNLVAMEALTRWRHPLHGLIPASRFIELAEDTGLINPLGEWALRQACQDAMSWPEQIAVSVNVSAVQFRRSDVLEIALLALVESGLPPERLEIEVSETVLMEKDRNCIAVLNQFRNVGVSIALDDFGTGYSSLSYLTMFAFDKIKIDRSFTREIGKRADCTAVFSAIVGLGRTLGLEIVAEGVETEQQLALVRAIGVPQAQGYLFGQPKPLADIDFAAGHRSPAPAWTCGQAADSEVA